MKPCSLFQVHCLFLVIATCVGTVAVFGQARDTASLSGTVADSQAAVVPGANITLINTATGAVRNLVSDGSGGFVITLLPVGAYTLTVEQPGFRKYERKGIVLQANENIRVDVNLEV